MTDTSTTESPPPPPISKSELMVSVGRLLQERRAARSLTLEKITQAIKIRLPYLQAMEKGEWDQLPGEVYVRGFIRRYANYLGLDGDKLIEPYLKLSEIPKEKKVDLSMERGPSEFGRTQIIWGIVGIVLIIGFLKVIKQEKNMPIKAAVPVAKVTGDGPPVPPASTKSDENAPVLVKHRIDVFSPFPLWLRATAGEKAFEGFIPQNSTWTWKGEGTITVRLGHTKQVVLLFDGTVVSLADDQKKVVLPSE